MIVERLREVLERAETARKSAGSERVSVVAVSKRQPDASLESAYAAGHRDFGENYVQELLRKRAMFPDARWHAIGHVQRNKAKAVASAHLVHTLDSVRLADTFEKGGVSVRALIEVNLAAEPAKAGASVADVEPLVEHALSLRHVEVCGLMCIPPVGQGRRWFAELRALRDRVASATGVTLVELSMGMSTDFEDAILEGATLVRVGTAIFGERSQV